MYKNFASRISPERPAVRFKQIKQVRQVETGQTNLASGPVVDEIHDGQQRNLGAAFSAPRALKPHCCHADHEAQTQQVSSLHSRV